MNKDYREKYIDGEKVLLEVSYSVLGRLLALVLRVFGCLITFFTFFAVEALIVKIICLIVFFISILMFLSIAFFKRLIFTDNKIIKVSRGLFKNSVYFLSYRKMDTTVSKSYFGGSLMFWKKNYRFTTVWNFYVDFLPISNEELKKLREVLISKQVIKGDKHGWNY